MDHKLSNMYYFCNRKSKKIHFNGKRDADNYRFNHYIMIFYIYRELIYEYFKLFIIDLN